MRKFCRYWKDNFHNAFCDSWNWMGGKGIVIELIIAAIAGFLLGESFWEGMGYSVIAALAIFGLIWLICGLFITPYKKDTNKQNRINELLTREEIDISLEPKSRENGNYVSLKVTNNNQEKPVLCKAIIRKMDYFKQDIMNAGAGEWEPRNTEERGPLSWHQGVSDEGFKKIHINPEFINIVKISDDMNDLIRGGRMLFTFLQEKAYLIGKYRVCIDVICKSDEVYTTESWQGCIDQDFTSELTKLLIMECEDVKDWK